MMNSRTIETKNSNIWNARDVRFVGVCAETNRATCDPIRGVEGVGAREVIGRRHADEGGLVRDAGETAGPGMPRESRLKSRSIAAIKRRRENEHGLVHAAGQTAAAILQSSRRSMVVTIDGIRCSSESSGGSTGNKP